MNLIEGLQDLMSQVPLLVQPLLVALAAAIPFIEGELAAVLGVWAGLNPFVAFLAAAAGNFLSVFVVVVFGARIREMITTRQAKRRELVPTGAEAAAGSELAPPEEPKPESKGRQRFRRFLVRYGVPGASLLGPLALPTQFTSAMLVAAGVSKSWILLWQAAAIILWTGFATALTVGVLTLLFG